MPARRLAPGPDRPARATVRFQVDGRALTGLEGESVATSLLAAGRSTLSRSFRFHRGRGLMCDTGRCGWCACRIDGRPSVHSCQVPVREGLRVESEHAWPSISRDLLSLLGLGARFVSPTFYHHRFLRPRRFRRAYLDVLRALGGRGRLTIGAERPAAMDQRPARRLEERDVDVLVVGGGEGGLLAAIGAAEAGASVLVLDERAADDDPLGGRARADLLTQALASAVAVWAGARAIGWYGDRVTALDAARQIEIRATVVVAATGTIEDVPRVTNADRPGVLGARLVERLLAADVLPGERILLLGEAERDGELEALGERLRTAGAATIGPLPTDALVAVQGRRSVRGVTLRGPDGRRRPEAVDAVVFADRRPTLDLPLAAGAALSWADGSLIPAIDGEGRTSVPGLFVAGGAAGRSVRYEAAREAARATGSAAARAALRVPLDRVGSGLAPAEAGQAADPARPAAPAGDDRPGDPPRPHHLAADSSSGSATTAGAFGPKPDPGTIACFCEDVHVREIEHECRTGYADPELVKRRTGALTGPCQGAYCRSMVTCVIARATGAMEPAATGSSAPSPLPTARPPLRPTRLADLAVDASTAEAGAVPGTTGP